jgi:hypothetical protein
MVGCYCLPELKQKQDGDRHGRNEEIIDDFVENSEDAGPERFPCCAIFFELDARHKLLALLSKAQSVAVPLVELSNANFGLVLPAGQDGWNVLSCIHDPVMQKFAAGSQQHGSQVEENRMRSSARWKNFWKTCY